MSSTFRPARFLAAPLAAFALVAAGLAAAPAQADPADTTVTVHVQNATGAAISDLNVTLFKEGAWVGLFEDKSAPGTYTSPDLDDDGNPLALDPGAWTIDAYDGSQTRPYADARTAVTVVDGANVVPTMTLQVGGIVKGKVTGPSGRSIKNVQVTATPYVTDPDNYGGEGIAAPAGVYRILGLKAARYKFSYVIAYEGKSHRIPGSRQVKVGGTSTVNIHRIKVPAFIDGTVTGKSTTKHKATVTIKGIGKFFGLNNPHGKVKVKEGKKTLKKNVKVNKGNAKFSLSGLKKGKHRLTVSYSGGKDVKDSSKTITVVVK